MAQTELALYKDRIEFFNDSHLPAVLTPHSFGISSGDADFLVSVLKTCQAAITELKLKHGGVLFRGFELRSAEDFGRLMAAVYPHSLRPYIGGTSPRVPAASDVYESTEFPARLRLPQHNEMSYLPDPPAEIYFFCEVQPSRAGETPLADSRLIYNQIPLPVREDFETKGIRYHRYLFGSGWGAADRARNRFVHLHRSWMETFDSSDLNVVEKLCADQQLQLTWDDKGGALITNILPAVRTHPLTGEKVWFNQASTFLLTPHATGWIKYMLYHLSLPDPLRRPFHATYGTGEPIPLAHLNRINETIDSITVRFPWRQGDLLVLDNYLVSHGRMPFRGARRILVTMH
jgi:alpha-ketoglutarate-dependent taurine dioxygenase